MSSTDLQSNYRDRNLKIQSSNVSIVLEYAKELYLENKIEILIATRITICRNNYRSKIPKFKLEICKYLAIKILPSGKWYHLKISYKNLSSNQGENYF